MSNWYSIYHQALLVRLVSIVVIFVVVGPVRWLLLITFFRLMRHFLRRIGQHARPPLGHSS